MAVYEWHYYAVVVVLFISFTHVTSREEITVTCTSAFDRVLIACLLLAMSTAQSLLHSNAQWAQEVQSSNPDFCRNSAKGQSPHVTTFYSSYPSLLIIPLDLVDWMCRFSRSRVCYYRCHARCHFHSQEHSKVSIVCSRQTSFHF